MITLPLTELAALLDRPAPAINPIFQGVSTDTRTLQPNNLFIALTGDHFNGHDFVKTAYDKGASAALVSQNVDCPIPQILVNDTLAAFTTLSQNWRNRFTLPIVGVTGSNGKTTLKNMIASIFRSACQQDESAVLATQGNLNNHIGVPIMLARLNQHHRYAVMEMGMNHFGEIAHLTHLVKPTVAVINNAAEAHLEGVKSVAGVARAKGEIFLGLKEDGVAIINDDDPYCSYWQSLVNQQQIIRFGLTPKADVHVTIHAPQEITIHTTKGNIAVKLPLIGEHNIKNALAATAAALALDIELNAIQQGLENVEPAHGRMEQHTLSNGARVIDDTYNANPFSLQAAIHALATFNTKKILVLGDMRELGPNAKELHFQSGEKIRAAGIDYLFTLGELSAAASEAFGQHAQHFTERDALITTLKTYLENNTTVLIKGSRSMKMEQILAGILPT